MIGTHLCFCKPFDRHQEVVPQNFVRFWVLAPVPRIPADEVEHDIASGPIRQLHSNKHCPVVQPQRLTQADHAQVEVLHLRSPPPHFTSVQSAGSEEERFANDQKTENVEFKAGAIFLVVMAVQGGFVALHEG